MLYSKVENSQQIFKEIDNFNIMNELKTKKNLMQNTSDKVVEISNLSKRLNHLSTQTLNKILGADLC